MTPRRPSRRARILRRFLREDGVATVEFTLALPIFLMIFMASFESALLMTRFVILERAVDMTVRDLRLGNFEDPTHDSVKTAICGHTVLFNDCENALMLELRPVSTTTWQPLGTDTRCVDRSAEIQPVTQFTMGDDNEMMLVRACAVYDPIFPLTGIGLKLPKDATGGYALVTSSAFVNEPS